MVVSLILLPSIAKITTLSKYGLQGQVQQREKGKVQGQTHPPIVNFNGEEVITSHAPHDDEASYDEEVEDDKDEDDEDYSDEEEEEEEEEGDDEYEYSYDEEEGDDEYEYSYDEGEGTDDDESSSSSSKKNNNQSKDATTDKNADDGECTFQTPYSEAPIPLILMSHGRSGSSVTWDTLSRMLGSTTTAYEITGGNRTKAANYFDSIDPKESKTWATDALCKIQKYNMVNQTIGSMTTSGDNGEKVIDYPVITGFQWKPYLVTLKHPMGKDAFKSIAQHTDPTIKVLFLTRNPLDRLISNKKHKKHKERKHKVPAHCTKDNAKVSIEKCLKRHAKNAMVRVPWRNGLGHTIKHSYNVDQLTIDLLSSHGVKYLIIEYEKLYNLDDGVDEWIRIFDFLGRSPKHVKNYREDLTREHVENAFAMVPTHSKRHNETISNYDDVREKLIELGYENLLH